MTDSRQINRHPIRQSSYAIREALSYIASSGIPAQHKSVLIEVVEHALAEAEPDRLPIVAAPESKQWQPHEVQIIAGALEGKVAVSWQHADELLMLLVKRLQRSPDEIKSKATELCFGAGIDYRVAKALVPRQSE